MLIRSSFVMVVFIIIMMMFAGNVISEAPGLISYQGKATDTSGNPVPDGYHNVIFGLYNAATNGQNVWSEDVTVMTSGGLFSHNLGSGNPIDPTDFNWEDSMFLEVVFDGEVQTPRTILTSSPYAYHVNSIDGSDGGIVDGYIHIHSDAADDEIVGIEASTGNSKIWLKDIDGHNRIELKSDSRSLEFYNYDVTSTPATITSQGSSIIVNSGQSGDASVQLPNNAVSSSEILNEPGVGSCMGGLSVFLEDDYTSVCEQTIVAPSSGYVFAIATAHVELFHVTGTSSCCAYGVSQNASDLPWALHNATCLSLHIPSGQYMTSISSHAVFPVSAGAKTFYFLCKKELSDLVEIDGVHFTVIFFPTAYTTVVDPSSSLTPGDFESEREAEREFHEAGLQADLDKVKADMELMKKELESVKNNRQNE